MNPRSTNYEADAQTTTSSRRYCWCWHRSKCECLGSVDWHSLSALLAVSLLISSGAISESKCRLLVLVSLRLSVMVQQALFRAGSNLLPCADLDHTGHAFSAAI